MYVFCHNAICLFDSAVRPKVGLPILAAQSGHISTFSKLFVQNCIKHHFR